MTNNVDFIQNLLLLNNRFLPEADVMIKSIFSRRGAEYAEESFLLSTDERKEKRSNFAVILSEVEGSCCHQTIQVVKILRLRSE